MLPSHRRTAVLFVLAGAAAAVANGPRAWAPAAWLAPLLFLRALHFLPVAAGAALGSLVYAAATLVAARGMLPLQGGLYVLAAACIGMGAVTPFVVHRALAPRLPLGLVPLLFPVAATAMEFLGSRLQPFGSFGAVAYTQAAVLPLWQVAAVAGLPGIAFLVYLPAAMLHFGLDHRPPLALLKRGLVAAGLLLLAVLGLGVARLKPQSAAVPAVPVAVVISPLHDRLSQLLAPAYATGDPATVNWTEALRQGERVISEMIVGTERAAAAGARIVLWPETAAIVTAQSEPALLKIAGALTRAHDMYLAVALGVVRHRARPWPAGDGALDNKVVLIGPSGEPVAQYRKSIAVPGPEAELLVPSTGTIPILQTPYGRIGLAICFDMDFPKLMRQAAGADLVLVPAEDWRGITPYHSYMARLRGIEGGYAVVRAARYGLSMAADSRGRMLAALPDGLPGTYLERLMFAQVPMHGRPTTYSRLGDVVGWLAVGVFCLLSLLALGGRRRAEAAVLLDERPSGAGDHRETPK